MTVAKGFKHLNPGEGIYLESKNEWRSIYKMGPNEYLASSGAFSDDETVPENILSLDSIEAFETWRRWVATREFHSVSMFFEDKRGHVQLVRNRKKNHIEEADKDFMKDLKKL